MILLRPTAPGSTARHLAPAILEICLHLFCITRITACHQILCLRSQLAPPRLREGIACEYELLHPGL